MKSLLYANNDRDVMICFLFRTHLLLERLLTVELWS